MAVRSQLEKALLALLGPAGLLTDAAARRVYALDSSHLERGRPWAVALPATPAEAAGVVRLCAEHQVPLVCRGSGTGLSGGAVPEEGALVLGTSRLNRSLGLDPTRRLMEVQPGILNEEVSRLGSPHGLHFAPDPSSQAAASIGGNIAENAGGPHCLRYGVTLQHVRRLDWVDARGRAWKTGRGLPAERGLDLKSLLCGSEGTLGVVTGASLNMVPDPPVAVTLLAIFPDLNDATEAVVSLLTAGLLPVAVEMVDQAMLLAVEEAFGFGFPTDVEGAMIAEWAGTLEEVQEDATRAGHILRDGGAREVREAWDEAERLELWKCRKKAFGAVGRMAPRYVTMDVVVPLEELPTLVRRIQEIRREYGVEVATAFHAGDGNLHPGVHYDDRQPGAAEKAHQAADAIIRAALDLGGSVTGEHGVGIEKLHVLPWQWDGRTAHLSHGVKAAFDPLDLLNPGKLLPPLEAEYAPCPVVPAGINLRRRSLTVTAPAQATLAEVQAAAMAEGLVLPVGAWLPAEGGCPGLGRGLTVGDLLGGLLPGPGVLAQGTARDFLLELWARTGDGHLFHSGAPVFKNVAGYGIEYALCGAGEHFVQPEAATFQLKPLPEAVLVFEVAGALPSTTRIVGLVRGLRSGDTSATTVVLDRDEGRLIIMRGGRDRPWDLGRFRETLDGIFGGQGTVTGRVLPTRELPAFLSGGGLPPWARSSSSWSLWQTTGAASLDAGRFIWQDSPEVIWVPDADAAAQPGWHVDSWWKNGCLQPPPAPPSDVPLDLIRRLQGLFDPDGRLPALPWLCEEEDRHHG